jgi:hypothetical protein
MEEEADIMSFMDTKSRTSADIWTDCIFRSSASILSILFISDLTMGLLLLAMTEEVVSERIFELNTLSLCASQDFLFICIRE